MIKNLGFPKRLLALLTTLPIMFICLHASAAMPKPTSQFYAADYADLLSDETEQFIVAHSKALCDVSQAQIVVATVPDMGGQSEREYALELARSWQIGGKSNNGVLIFVALAERKIDIEVGYGLEGAIPDSKAGRLIDTYALSYLKDNDFDGGILNLYQAVLQEVYTEYGLDVPENVAPVEVEDEDDSETFDLILTIVFALVCIWLIGRGKGGRGGRGPRIFFFPSGGSRGSSGGFGGFGGHSGGFGGGGGSFGGGGSSRGF